MSYSGETAYITGGASGIGRFLAERLVSKGMKVVVSDRNFEGAEEVAKDLNKNGQVAWAAQVDVADWDSQKQAFETAVEKLGRIHYVFPVAGITERLWIPNEPSGDGFVKPDLSVFDINGTGALYTSALATQHFRAQQPNKYGFRGKSKTGISSNEFYDKIEAKGLLTPVETLLSAFEELLGDCTTSGEAIEILPGGGGSKIKERPEYTSEECKISVELAHARSYKAFFGASRATQS
ncbi:unnamed protein product [Clonostachys byssicola]|uniref:Uncharacterized protein n=1 Tax=Clonostachys byssicola TaxID=160290 RepID=A0A9N9Y7W0_9HYPO|nr:unnamed protein product [Clonostachys byssicola]